MNDGQSAKQNIVEQIKQSANILVTVSTDPSVDELSAALGMTVLLNKLNKHATAVVSGAIPPAIEFLQPGKTFENTVDSLRDFIIALDKEKADHLRYKVEGDVVKIFITPYRTTISQKDLDFSQGDYNVELVLALGVKDQGHLDKALEAHGRILHDATVATVTCGEPSDLGSISWNEPSASSISEMLVSLSEAIKSDEKVIDEQISTAFLTGIVAATDRFSNDKTSSKVMTMAAQLMAAGANQQLIAAKLEEAHEITNNPPDAAAQTPTDENRDGTTDLKEGTSSKVNKGKKKKAKPVPAQEPKKDETAPDGSLAISHERQGDLDEVARDVAHDNQTDAAVKAEAVLADQLKEVAPAAVKPSPDTPSVADLQKDVAAASQELEQSAKQEAPPEQSFGGTLNATTQQAEQDKRRELENDRNKTILSHAAPVQPGSIPTIPAPPINASVPSAAPDPVGMPMLPPLPPADVPEPAAPLAPPSLPLDETPQSSAPTLEELDRANRQTDHADALADVHAAFEAAPIPVPAPFEPNLEQPTPDQNGLPPLPDFSTLPPPPPPSPASAPVAPVPSAPVFDVPPSSQPEQLGQIFGPPESVPAPAPPPQPADPGQFRIPGQG